MNIIAGLSCCCADLTIVVSVSPSLFAPDLHNFNDLHKLMASWSIKIVLLQL